MVRFHLKIFILTKKLRSTGNHHRVEQKEDHAVKSKESNGTHILTLQAHRVTPAHSRCGALSLAHGCTFVSLLKSQPYEQAWADLGINVFREQLNVNPFLSVIPFPCSFHYFDQPASEHPETGIPLSAGNRKLHPHYQKSNAKLSA